MPDGSQLPGGGLPSGQYTTPSRSHLYRYQLPCQWAPRSPGTDFQAPVALN